MARKKPTKKAKLIADQAVNLAEYAAKALVAAEQLRVKTKAVERFPLDDDERATVAALSSVAAKLRRNLAKHDGGADMDYEDSTSTKISAILPKSGKRSQFEYEYDFGDSWHHDILFGGCVRAEQGGRYPVCVEGSRACPPEDVGGVWGYAEFLNAMADPDHERHDEFSRWIGGSFDSEAFDAAAATKRMRRGLPDWRSEQWI